MIIGVIQARLTSSRFPGKVLHKVNGKPLLQYMIESLSFSKELDDLYVAIPNNTANEPLKNFLIDHKIKFITGSEEDVLQRFFQVGQENREVTAVVRFTGDCPLIDPGIVDKVIAFYRRNTFDYVRTGSTFADGQGVEIFSWKALQTAEQMASDSIDREHVTTFFKNNPEQFKCISLENETDDTHLRYTVDTELDLQVVKKIIQHFGNGKQFFNSKEIRKFLLQHPEVRELNQNQQRQHLNGRI